MTNQTKFTSYYSKIMPWARYLCKPFFPTHASADDDQQQAAKVEKWKMNMHFYRLQTSDFCFHLVLVTWFMLPHRQRSVRQLPHYFDSWIIATLACFKIAIAFKNKVDRWFSSQVSEIATSSWRRRLWLVREQSSDWARGNGEQISVETTSIGEHHIQSWKVPVGHL